MRSKTVVRNCIAYLFAACVSTVTSGCKITAHVEQQPPESIAPLTGRADTAPQPPTATLAAIDAQDRIIVHYQMGNQNFRALAALDRSNSGIPESSPQTNIAVLLPLDPVASPAPSDDEEASVVIRSAADWSELVKNLAIETAALVPGKGVVLDVLLSRQ